VESQTRLGEESNCRVAASFLFSPSCCGCDDTEPLPANQGCWKNVGHSDKVCLPKAAPTIFQNKKSVLLGETSKEKPPRYYKYIGLGFKTPKEAIEGTYIEKKCPSTECRETPMSHVICTETNLVTSFIHDSPHWMYTQLQPRRKQ
ncbi:hypothetical protein A6R68_01502, partial [Neotoma lepida]